MYTIVITGLQYAEQVDLIKHIVKSYLIGNSDCPFIRRCTHDAVCEECIVNAIHVLHTPDC